MNVVAVKKNSREINETFDLFLGNEEPENFWKKVFWFFYKNIYLFETNTNYILSSE